MNVPSLRLAATALCWVVFASVGGGRCCCRAGWVDPDTPNEFRTTTSNFAKDTREFGLVRELLPFANWINCAFSLLFTSILLR